MRCTRCDSVAVPQAVGIACGGLVVFGWCMTCLAEEGCELVEVPGSGLKAAKRPARRRPAKSPPVDPVARGRRIALRVVAAVLALWGLFLAVIGLLRFPGWVTANGWARSMALLWGWSACVMALLSLVILAISFEPKTARRFALKAMQVGGASLGIGVLVWGVIWHEPRRDTLVVSMAFVAFGISWLAHAWEWRLEATGQRGQSHLAHRRGRWRARATRWASVMLAGTGRAIRRLAARRFGRMRGESGD
jgi:hypothetical protein